MLAPLATVLMGGDSVPHTKDLSVNEGETVRLGLNPARLHLFDKATGRSLLHGHPE